jgi:hypothetical protein
MVPKMRKSNREYHLEEFEYSFELAGSNHKRQNFALNDRLSSYFSVYFEKYLLSQKIKKQIEDVELTNCGSEKVSQGSLLHLNLSHFAESIHQHNRTLRTMQRALISSLGRFRLKSHCSFLLHQKRPFVRKNYQNQWKKIQVNK